jgi:hypothetical protein
MAIRPQMRSGTMIASTSASKAVVVAPLPARHHRDG